MAFGSIARYLGIDPSKEPYKVKRGPIVAMDFDGTLTKDYTGVGEHRLVPNIEALFLTTQFIKQDWKIILFTCREGKYLQEAVDWSNLLGVTYDSLNEALFVLDSGYTPRKPYYDLLIDDRSRNLHLINEILRNCTLKNEFDNYKAFVIDTLNLSTELVKC